MMRPPKVDFCNDTTNGNTACRQCIQRAMDELDYLIEHYRGRAQFRFDGHDIVGFLRWRREVLEQTANGRNTNKGDCHV